MKTLRKYANMAFLLIAVTTIVPAYANLTVNEQDQIEQIKQEDTFVESQKAALKAWYNRPVREKIYEVLTIGGWIVFISAAAYFMAKRQTQINDPYKWKVMGYALSGCELIEVIKKLDKTCPGCRTCNNN